MLENVIIRGIYASRYVMSWTRMKGEIKWRAGYSEFNEWLKSLGLDKNEIEAIVEIARSGKMELETSAKAFLKNIKKTEELESMEEA